MITILKLPEIIYFKLPEIMKLSTLNYYDHVKILKRKAKYLNSKFPNVINLEILRSFLI
jgi:hypothetical protein